MTGRMALFLLALLSPLGLLFAEAPERCELPRPISQEFLLGITEIPFGKDTDAGGDVCHWEIVSLGLPAIPELLPLVDDPTITPLLVPLFGGSYAVGDIALRLIGSIVNVPVVELIPSFDPGEFQACGFCVYWNFVRKSPSNWQALRHAVEDWYSTHLRDLKWRPVPQSRSGGWYEVHEE